MAGLLSANDTYENRSPMSSPKSSVGWGSPSGTGRLSKLWGNKAGKVTSPSARSSSTIVPTRSNSTLTSSPSLVSNRASSSAKLGSINGFRQNAGGESSQQAGEERSENEGLGFHMEEASTPPLFIKKRTQSATAGVASTLPAPSSENITSIPTFPDFAIPELADSVSNIDHQLLLSPFTLASPHFEAGLQASPEVPTGSSAAPSFSGSNRQQGSARVDASITPQSAPRQRFFQTGSSSASFTRFPTPDKLALGFTPSPVASPSQLHPTAKVASPQRLQVTGRAATVTSVPLSSSNNTLASQISSDSSDSSPSCLETVEGQIDGTLDRSSKRKSRHGQETEDIRASLLQFPSPPCSPRMFEGFAASMSEAMDSLRPNDTLNVASPSLASSKGSWGGTTPALTSCDTSTEDNSEAMDDARPSLDSVQLPYTNTPEKARRYTSQFADAAVPFPSFFLPPLDIRVPAKSEKPSADDILAPLQPVAPLTLPHKASIPSLPPNEPLPALPAPASVAAKQKPAIFGGSPVGRLLPTASSSLQIVQDEPNALEAELAADTFAIADAIINGTPPPTPRARSREPSYASPLHQNNREHAPRSASQATTAASERLKESLQGSDCTQAEKADARKRRASLSIKIPRLLSKLRRAQPSPALPITPLDGPGSRFSPESEAPPSPHVRPNFVKRLTRAVSSPNLRGSASVVGLPIASAKEGSRFVTPTSAPPVPTDFQHLFSAPLAPSGLSTVDSPLSTPALTADSALTTTATPPLFKQPQPSALPSEYSLQNPYFPEASNPPASQDLLPNDDSAAKRCRSPSSPEDMQWLEGQPGPAAMASCKTQGTDNKQSSPLESDTVRQASSSSPSEKGISSASANRVHYAPAPSKTASSGSDASSTSNICSGSAGSDEDDEDDDRHSRRSQGNSDDCDEYGASEEGEDADSEDDDIPLATAHPDALKAQKSLKATMKERRAKKDTTKGSTSMRKAVKEAAQKEPPESVAMGRSSSARSAPTTVKRISPRKQNTAPTPSRYNPFNFVQDDLSGKKTKDNPNATRGRSATLRSEAEAKRPDSTGDRPHTLLLPQTDEQVKRRNRSRGREDLAPPLAPFVQDSVLTMSEGSDDDDDVPLKIAGAGKRSVSNAQQHKSARNVNTSITKTNSVKAASEPARSITKSPPQRAAPLPVAIAPSELASASRPSYHSKQRVYINDPQHHFMCDIDERTTPLAILQHLRSKGMISSNPAWAVVEMWRTLGVERPMREYELLQDSIQSWGTDPNASLFLVKKTSLASKLLSTCQTADNEGFGGWVQMEVKRGKWSKRWIEIRSQSIFVGKSEKARDQTMLCSLSSFDAYVVPQPCVAKLKAPKACAFGLKSVDKVSLFENAQDYIHYFSIKTEAERDTWVEKILDARSSLVRQLLAARAAAPAHDTRTNIIAQPVQAASIGRSNSRHQSPPLPQGAVFAEGSLLARKPSSTSMTRDGSLQSPSSLVPPPVPAIPTSAIPNGSFAHIPQDREWEKLSPAERQRHILEAERKARTEGKPLLELDKPASASRNRSKSVSATKQ